MLGLGERDSRLALNQFQHTATIADDEITRASSVIPPPPLYPLWCVDQLFAASLSFNPALAWVDIQRVRSEGTLLFQLPQEFERLAMTGSFLMSLGNATKFSEENGTVAAADYGDKVYNY